MILCHIPISTITVQLHTFRNATEVIVKNCRLPNPIIQVLAFKKLIICPVRQFAGSLKFPLDGASRSSALAPQSPDRAMPTTRPLGLTCWIRPENRDGHRGIALARTDDPNSQPSNRLEDKLHSRNVYFYVIATFIILSVFQVSFLVVVATA